MDYKMFAQKLNLSVKGNTSILDTLSPNDMTIMVLKGITNSLVDHMNRVKNDASFQSALVDKRFLFLKQSNLDDIIKFIQTNPTSDVNSINLLKNVLIIEIVLTLTLLEETDVNHTGDYSFDVVQKSVLDKHRLFFNEAEKLISGGIDYSKISSFNKTLSVVLRKLNKMYMSDLTDTTEQVPVDSNGDVDSMSPRSSVYVQHTSDFTPGSRDSRFDMDVPERPKKRYKRW